MSGARPSRSRVLLGAAGALLVGYGTLLVLTQLPPAAWLRVGLWAGGAVAAHDLLLRLRREAWMASAATELDVVKTPHHGSANLDPGLLAAVRSPVAVVSVGEDNDYGHPTAAHLAMLTRNGYAVHRTDQRGHIALVERDGRIEVVTQR